ncbi:MAG: VWA domain-containing protein [Acidobacteria bacterium]|nr:VWA domain-containing protein [Acidobacteriota bacterium]
MRAFVLRLALTGAVTAATLHAQQPTAPAPQGFRDTHPFRSGVEVTTITATVLDKDGHLITGLPREAFEVYEDNIRQPITNFTHDRVPIGLGVLLDISDSMFGKRIQDARAAVDRFLFDLLDPSDEFFLMAFNHRPRPMTGWTRARAEVERALESLKPSGGTAIYDAIVEALPMIDRRERDRAAIVVISDGADTASNATLRDLHTALLRSDTFVYAIAIDPPDRRAINTSVNVQALREITSESGGRTEVVQSSENLKDATARIAEELNRQYMLGYVSPHPADGEFHSIRVKITGTDHRVRARNGYVATPLTRPKL